MLADPEEHEAETKASAESLPAESPYSEDTLVVPLVASPPESKMVMDQPEPALEADTETKLIVQAEEAPKSSLRDDIRRSPVNRHVGTSITPKRRVNALRIGLVAGFIALAIGGGIYLWWHQPLTQPSSAETSSTREAGVELVTQSDMTPVPRQPEVMEMPPSPQMAEATVPPIAETAPPPQLLTRPSQAAVPEAKSVPAQRAAETTSEPARGAARQMEPEYVPAPVRTPTRQQEAQPPPEKSAPLGVPEIIASKCVGRAGLQRIVCEEEHRLKLCTGKWGSVPGCPKFEQPEDPFNF